MPPQFTFDDSLWLWQHLSWLERLFVLGLAIIGARGSSVGENGDEVGLDNDRGGGSTLSLVDACRYRPFPAEKEVIQ
jgi:hypothetical protein